MLRVFINIIISLVLFSAGTSWAAQPLTADQAFAFSSHMDKKNELTLEWQIAPGYHLYRDQTVVRTSQKSQVKIGQVILPPGVTIKDKVLGPVSIYEGTVKVHVPILNPITGILNLKVHYQGCSGKGFCYAPQDRIVQVDLAAVDPAKNLVISDSAKMKSSTQDYESKFFSGENNFLLILSFLGIGLLLAFTPCVLPMVPILSGIIVGHGKHITTMKAFLLSFAYVMGMAITYAIAGMIVAMIGSHIQTLFQSKWVIYLFSGFFVLLAFSLFGFFEMETPAHWRKRVTNWSYKHKGGTYFGVFMMGALSSLILSPCVSAPLVGVLAYIAQTGNVIFGGVSLLALGIGMGIPLLLIGVSAGKLLPKSGPWMVTIKKLFGILMLAMTIWMLSRVIPGPVALFLWSVLFICTAIFMDIFKKGNGGPWPHLKRGLGVVILIYGVILLIGAAMGNCDPFHPWEGARIELNQKRLQFVTVTSMDDLSEKLATAQRNHKPVMLDFYADWCTACVAMQRFVFVRPRAQEDLVGYVVLRVDVTHNTDFDQAVLKRYNVIAPPTILFFNANGEELASARIVGEVDANEFSNHVQQLNLVQN